jgi:hypothetical protein
MTKAELIATHEAKKERKPQIIVVKPRAEILETEEEKNIISNQKTFQV